SVKMIYMRKLKNILERINIRRWIGQKAIIKVEWLTSCRPWKEWFDHHLPVTFRGGMKVDESAHHCYLFMLRKDCPRNLVIKCDNQTGTHLEPHELDVIVTVKTNAADDFLCQEAILAMPYQFMEPIVNSAPTAPRNLKRVQPAKAKKYLEFAQVLLRRFPSDTSGRAIQFFVDLVKCTDPGPLFPLPFYTTAGAVERIEISRPTALGRIVPAMVFQARIGR
ncbi:unnamed protein product, partial [Durusdinium trenchii]